jgi:hypothetical protein
VTLRDYLVQLGLVLLGGGTIAGIRYLIVRREKPQRRSAKR